MVLVSDDVAANLTSGQIRRQGGGAPMPGDSQAPSQGVVGSLPNAASQGPSSGVGGVPSGETGAPTPIPLPQGSQNGPVIDPFAESAGITNRYPGAGAPMQGNPQGGSQGVLRAYAPPDDRGGSGGPIAGNPQGPAYDPGGVTTANPYPPEAIGRSIGTGGIPSGFNRFGLPPARPDTSPPSWQGNQAATPLSNGNYLWWGQEYTPEQLRAALGFWGTPAPDQFTNLNTQPRGGVAPYNAYNSNSTGITFNRRGLTSPYPTPLPSMVTMNQDIQSALANPTDVLRNAIGQNNAVNTVMPYGIFDQLQQDYAAPQRQQSGQQQAALSIQPQNLQGMTNAAAADNGGGLPGYTRFGNDWYNASRDPGKVEDIGNYIGEHFYGPGLLKSWIPDSALGHLPDWAQRPVGGLTSTAGILGLPLGPSSVAANVGKNVLGAFGGELGGDVVGHFTDNPVAKFAGNLAGGVLGYESPSVIEHAPAALGGLTRPFTEGALSGEQGGAMIGRVPRQPIQFPAPQPAADLGDAGIRAALARKAETTAGPGLLSGSTVARKIGSLVNPSVDLDQGIHIANQAEAAVKADLATQFAATRKPLLEEIAQNFKPMPEYIGADRPLAGTFLDVAENPQDYVLTPAQKDTLAKIAARDTANVNTVRANYNADVGLYTPKNPDAIYLPHINANEDLVQQGVRTAESLSAPRVAKERVWDTASARAAHDPKFIPETGAAKLLEAHDNALAGMAGKETFKAGSGGLSRPDAMAQAFPALAKQRDDLINSVESIKGKLFTAEKRAKINDSVSTELTKALENARNADPTTDFGPLQTALRNSNKRLDEILTRRDTAKAGVRALKTDLSKAEDQLDEVRTRWTNANLTDKGFVQNKTTFQYHTPEASQSIDKLKEASNGRVVDSLTKIAETSRSTALSSDASPLTIQGQMNLWRDPVSTGVALFKRIKDGTTLQDVARAEPEMVSRFTQARARALGNVSDEFTASKSLFAKLPKVGGAIGRAEDALMGPMQRIEYEAWKRTVNLLEKTHPDLTPAQLDHEAANALSKTVPGLSSVERGVSPARAQIERSLLTSTSFLSAPGLVIKDATSGLAKILAHGGDLSAAKGRELIALKHLLTIAGTVETISLVSAALNADNRGMSVEDAIKHALIPGGKDFMAIQLGTRSIPLGGPFRSTINGLTPRQYQGKWEAPDLGRFALSKVAPLPRSLIDLTRNQDFQGNAIRGGSQWSQILQSLEYGGESFVPLTGTAVPQGIRAGKNATDIGFDAASQASGQNISETSQYEDFSTFTRKNYQGRDPDQLSASETKQAKADFGYTSTSPEGIAAEDRTKTLMAQQNAADQRLASHEPGYTVQNWKDDYHTRVDELRVRKDEIYKNAGTKPGGDAILDGYYNALNLAGRPDGTVDWNQMDAYTAGLSPSERSYISQNTGLSLNTPMVTEYRNATKAATDTGLYDIGDAAWAKMQGYNATLKAYDSYDAWQAAALKRALQLSGGSQDDPIAVQRAQAIVNNSPIVQAFGDQRFQADVAWAKAHPQDALAALKWGLLGQNPRKDLINLIDSLNPGRAK